MFATGPENTFAIIPLIFVSKGFKEKIPYGSRNAGVESRGRQLWCICPVIR